MKKISQDLELVLKMEKDDPKNTTEMQLEAWLFNNNTEVLVRLYEHDKQAAKKLQGNKTDDEVATVVLTLLKSMGVVHDVQNWASDMPRTTNLLSQEENEELENHRYFSWYVKKFLIKF